jgi:hypothetical protein
MAVSRTASWTNSTGVVDYAAAATLNGVRITLSPSATAASYLQLFNATSATPGSDTPVASFIIPPPANGGNKTRSFPLPGGIDFSTGICSFVATAFNGGTAATTHAPLAVDVHFTPVA